MATLNAILRPLFDAALHPFRGVSPLLSLTLVSLIGAMGMLIVFKRTSDQDALAAVKRKIHAGLFEIRLFNDDLVQILRSQGEILRHNLTYFRLSLAPLAWMIVPLALVIAQLQFHYGYRGFAPGDPILLKAQLAGEADADSRPELSLDVPAGLRAETPALWMPRQRQAAWRLRAVEPGEYLVTVRAGGAEATKSVLVADGILRRSPVRVTPSFLDLFLYPAESPLPAEGPFREISVSYPERDIDVFGVGIHWLIVFFVLSIALAFLLRGRFGVTI